MPPKAPSTNQMGAFIFLKKTTFQKKKPAKLS